VVFALNGDFDPAQVIKHGNDDAQLFENFKQLDASMAPYNGYPSSMIQGSYNSDNGARLHSWNRIVLPTGSPPAKQRYFRSAHDHRSGRPGCPRNRPTSTRSSTDSLSPQVIRRGGRLLARVARATSDPASRKRG